jgi:uncharacterized secreted repeat protein (TIGR03808 family)
VRWRPPHERVNHGSRLVPAQRSGAELEPLRLHLVPEAAMSIDRRRLLLLTAAATVAAEASGAAAAPSLSGGFPVSALGVDAAQFGLRPGSSDDQSKILQQAIDQAAGERVPLALAPGAYRVGNLKLQAGTQLVGVRGATRLVLTEGPSLMTASFADRISLTGLTLDGAGKPLPDNRGLVHLASGRALRIVDCEITAAGRQGLVLDAMEGEVRGTAIIAAAGAGLLSLNARGLVISGNTVRGCANNGIQIWRTDAGDDGTLVVGNRIEETAARAGGSGQNGNAINVFRAANVVVSGNRISGAAFSAVRGNAASNLQVTGNSCSGCGEVALYAEFGFEGAILAQNLVDGAAIGVSVTNFNHGGRLAVVHGNIIRNLVTKRPPGTDPNDGAGIGIAVEADTAVTGNVIEGAPVAGISAGWGRHLRDVTITGNVVRRVGVGIAVSVAAGAGAAVIADNLIADAKNGAIVGMDLKKPITGDLAKDGAARYAQLAISGNRVR